MTAETDIDLDLCAAEPIRIPGSIQPHGALIVVSPADLVCLHASANAGAVLGVAPTIGQSLRARPEMASLAADVARWLESRDPVLLRVVEIGGRALQAQGHRTAQGALLEFEEPPASPDDTLEGLYPRLRAFLAAVSSAPDIATIARAATRELRALTGFNRLLLYSFDANGDGVVLAEDGDGELPSYLGQRFPASDIPSQARELYKLNRIRLIPDANYEPSPVEPAVSPVDGQPVDLSLAALRSVSPVHLEYMRNMGTLSSMSMSIIVDDELWGLISAHAREPRRVNAQIRTACDILAQIVSLQIAARRQAIRTAERLELKHIESELLGSLAAASSFQRGLVDNGARWMALTGANGAAVTTQDGVLVVGEAPTAEAIRTLARRLHEAGEEFFATDSLSERWPDAEAFAGVASGLLAISISRMHPDYIMWFRPEVVRVIDWSGDPTKPVIPGATRLHPRKSFEIWRQSVRLRGVPWTDAEIDSARGFRASIQDLVLRLAEERAALTDRLERINHELESFSYSVSHDLRAPFRHIVGYAELLRERERALDAKSLHYIETIKDAAINAGRLVDDLLRFSHLGRSRLEMTSIDMDKLVDEVRRTLEPDTRGRRFDWRVAPLPPAWGDPGLVRQLVQNLLQNAIKYTRGREVARIEMRGHDDGRGVTYAVADNGVGFEMAYASKLFGVFQRLHRAEDYEGTGIGLALVKRIVDRHGGGVSATGTPGVGATFTFTLPKPPSSGERSGG